MALIPVPTNLEKMFETATIKLVRGGVSMRSRYTGKRQAVGFAFALWAFEGRLMKLDPKEAGPVRSFLTQLQGQVNTFQLPVPGTDTPLSGYSGPAGLVNGANQTGTSVATDGWSPNTLILKQGDYFNLGTELKMVKADVTTNGSGVATITFEPALSAAPADNSVVKYQWPTVTLCCDEDDAASWDLTHPVLHDIKIKATEDL